MFILDANAKLQKIVVAGWKNGLWPHYGRYGSWCFFNVDPLTQEVKVSREAMYTGYGKDYRWHIKWS